MVCGSSRGGVRRHWKGGSNSGGREKGISSRGFSGDGEGDESTQVGEVAGVNVIEGLERWREPP